MNREREIRELFLALYETVNPLLLRISYNITGDMDVSEDICQEAFILLNNKIRHLNKEKNLRFWLIRVVKNLSINYLRRKKREVRVYKRVMETLQTEESSSEAVVINKEFKKMIHYAMQMLPVRLRETIVLVEYGQLSYREIGKILNISEVNVKVRISRARKKIVEILKEEGMYDPE